MQRCFFLTVSYLLDIGCDNSVVSLVMATEDISNRSGSTDYGSGDSDDCSSTDNSNNNNTCNNYGDYDCCDYDYSNGD